MPELTQDHSDNPNRGRRPTSHERRAGQPWDASYREGRAPWDIGCPQPAIARLISKRAFRGPVLDAGCGTGENALHIAARGLAVLGVDVAETAVAMAREKAEDRGVAAEFMAADAFELGRSGRKFRTVLDCGLFHSFDAAERRRYVASLAAVTEAGGMLYVLCFSDAGPELGPHPVNEQDLRAAFGNGSGWEILSLEAERIETINHAYDGTAWLAAVRRA